jgi:hypothetical protein
VIIQFSIYEADNIVSIYDVDCVVSIYDTDHIVSIYDAEFLMIKLIRVSFDVDNVYA